MPVPASLALALLLAPALAAADEPAVRVTLELTADGRGLLSVVPAVEPTPAPEGTVLDLDLPGVTAVRARDGDIFLAHDLTRPGALEAAARFGFSGAAPRPGAGVTLTPRPEEGGRVPTARLLVRTVGPPVTVECDLAAANSAGFGIKLRSAENAVLQAQLFDGVTAGGRNVAYFPPPEGGRRPEAKALVDSRRPAGERGVTHRFRLPRGGADAGRWTIEIFAFDPDRKETVVRRLVVRGDVKPSFGVALDAAGPTVLVEQVLPGGAAEAAGLEAGDVVRSIRGETPADLADAMAKLAAAELGVPTEFVVLRGPQTLTLPVTGR